MSDELNNYILTIDTKRALGELEEVEEKRKDTEDKIKKTTKEANKELQRTRMKAVSVMQGTWHSIETMMGAMGVTIPKLYRSIISSAFGAAKIMIPLFTAMELNPLTAIQGALGLMQIGLTVAGAIAAQREATETESALASMNSYIGGLSSFIGVYSF